MQFEERRAEFPTDTQHIVNLSAYHWAMETLGVHANMRVLDAACGTGYGSNALAVRAQSVVGVDRDVTTVNAASRRYRWPNLCFLPMDCEALAFKAASFDAVLSFETIEHLDDDRRLLREVARLLTPEGWLVLSTPHGKAPGAVPDNPFHRREYVWAELRGLLGEHFHSVRLFGRWLGPRLAGLERKLDSVRRFDPWGLRRFLPRGFRHQLGSLISRARGGIDLGEVAIADVEYCEGLTVTSTLLAICRWKVR
ncbi:MAG: class I SAM-dependent methyltransferase [Alphaproteobacteria bacterium]